MIYNKDCYLFLKIRQKQLSTHSSLPKLSTNRSLPTTLYPQLALYSQLSTHSSLPIALYPQLSTHRSLPTALYQQLYAHSCLPPALYPQLSTFSPPKACIQLNPDVCVETKSL
ncbi:hypothetical protein LSH36_12g34073 [Paralvinella palmiformis]|uniref:Uncharacterized protein n=1 Tax=Paralvinella palmiformis TaxID=53620 RepID=A0AAD9NJ87_9ANNE|nr:hypothetical protein LSH36_12g34073 [Paralvinella palmiformis]